MFLSKKHMLKSLLYVVLGVYIFALAVAVTAKAQETPYEEIKGLCYKTPISDCKVNVYSTNGGTVVCTKATAGFLMETGVRLYEEYPDKGYEFDRWECQLIYRNTDMGNRKINERYTFSYADNAGFPYDSKDETVQLNRLSTLGEVFFWQLRYKVVAYFTKI